MKFNKWTLGLAAVGVVSLASVAQAEEKAMNAVQTALSSTTISGYVSVSGWWNMGTGGNSYWGEAGYPYIPYSVGKQDGFNLDVVKLTIEKPLDEAQWAAGYKVDLLFGPDANGLATGSPLSGDVGNENADFAIQQAYVALRAPVGNGIDFKLGVFNSVIGYETFDAGNNPNYTRSYGYAMEPTTHTGVLATYRFSDLVAAAVGVANTYGPTINEKAHFSSDYYKAESYKTYMGSIALTAPEDWGWMKGATLYAGAVNGWDSSAEDVRHNYYVGVTLPTPATGLKLGAAYDYSGISSDDEGYGFWANTVAVYASWQATEKMALHLRGEYGWNALTYPDDVYYDVSNYDVSLVIPDSVFALTATLDYSLWENVLSRLEFRWDHLAGGDAWYSAKDGWRENAFLLAANVIYKF